MIAEDASRKFVCCTRRSMESQADGVPLIGSLRAVRPAPRWNGGTIVHLSLALEDGSDVGEATYPDQVKVGELLFFGGGRRFRVLDVVIFDEEDESRFVGLLQVQAAFSEHGR
jgi:hypothetical protein